MLDPSGEITDPATSAERLRQLAQQYPELRSRISGHPNCYPELRQWIAQHAATALPPQPRPSPLGQVDSPSPHPIADTRSTRGRKFWTRTKIFVSGAIALIGAVTGVISVIPILTRDATNFSHLEITAAPVAGEVSEWALPAEALDLDFPATGTACGPEQLSWLEANAEPMQRGFMLTLRNAASEGAMLALTEFRSTAAGDEDRGPVKIRFVCDPSGVMPELLYYGKLLADDPSHDAVHVKLQAGAAPNSSPEMPVAFNLAPGESGKIPLDLFSRNPVRGSIQAKVLSRDEERIVEIEGSEFEMPALLFAGEMFLFSSDEGPECYRVEAGTLASCTLDELKQEAEQAR